MSIRRLKAATGTHTPFCLLLLSIQRGVEGDGAARQKEEEGERLERDTDKKKRREWRQWALTQGEGSDI